MHWAQAGVYGWLLCQKRGLAEIRIALVYFDIVRETETIIERRCSAASLKQAFEQLCDSFLEWAAQELGHRVSRDRALCALRFPHDAFRTGQRQLAIAAYRAVAQGLSLIAQAPTGIGKTMGTLFPALKAMPGQNIDKIFFLTAKTTGRKLALDAVTQLRAANPHFPIRTVELVARDQACEHPDKNCHGESCPLAKGFYDRLPAARRAALSAYATLDKGTVREVALAHRVCPYYLAHELTRWADIVIGDYNYYFDYTASLFAMTCASQWRVAILVDEAHNMIERTRKMYTAELDYDAFKHARQSVPQPLEKAMARVGRQWSALNRDQPLPYQARSAIPAGFISAIQKISTEFTDYVSESPQYVNPALQRFCFDALHFCRMSELLDSNSIFDISSECGNTRLCIRNIIPAPHLKHRYAAARAAILFSATISPARFYTDMLGLPGETAWLDVESPFHPDQMKVHIVKAISTRYTDRDRSLSPIIELIAHQYHAQPGNYLMYFSSFDYLRKAAALLRARHPEIPLWEQSRGMPQPQKDHFLVQLTATSRGVGFAVLGGAFAEGIDLPGNRLIGAFIATLGMPQVNPVNEQIRRRMDAVFGTGFDYTYLYPGLRKVVQAAGRVIRTHTDRGVVYLIDDRYARPAVLGLLPRWWKIENSTSFGKRGEH